MASPGGIGPLGVVVSFLPVLLSATMRDERSSGGEGKASPVPTMEPGPPRKRETACSQCGHVFTRQGRSWCPQCGYVEELGTFVELQDWERVGTAGEDREWESSLNADGPWWRLIPTWVWVTGGGVIGIGMASVAGALSTAESSAARTYWSFAQILVGFAAFAVAHVTSFYLASMETDHFGPQDLFLRPLAIWGSTFRRLPEGAWRVYAATWGLMSILLAFTVVGGIPYDRFWDWGFKQPAERDLIQAVIDQARKHAKKKSADSGYLEDALAKLQEKEKGDDPPAVPLKVMDCLVVGYTTVTEDSRELDRLLLAALTRGQLAFVGSITADTIPETTRRSIQARLAGLERPAPIVAVPYEARWLAPKILCRVKYRQLDKNNRLDDAQFDALLADL